MGRLTGAQRKHLRGLAHGFKPAVTVGKEGLSDGVVRSISQNVDPRVYVALSSSAGHEKMDDRKW